MMKPLIKFVFCVAAVAGQTLQAETSNHNTGSHYVNMGSSFAAGSGLLPLSPGPLTERRCQRSVKNYASILADRLDLTLEDRSCGGAKSTHLLEPWNQLPPQMDAINSDTALVTITVGGNDLNYVRNLYATSCFIDEANGKKRPCINEEIVSEDTYLQLKNNFLAITNQIQTRSPHAKIIFIQYITLVPEKPCELTGLTIEDANRMRRIGERLAEITITAAKESGANVLPMNQLSIGHTACDSDPWSIAAVMTPDNNEGSLWHPNRLANEMIANHLEAMLTALNNK